MYIEVKNEGRLACLVRDEVLAELHGGAPEDPKVPRIRAYQKKIFTDSSSQRPQDMDGIKVVTKKPSRLASSDLALSRAATAVRAGLYNFGGEFSDTHSEGNTSSFGSRGWEWMHQFTESQVGENQPFVLQDRSKHDGYSMVSIRGARHENQDALHSDGQLFSVFDGHIGKSAAAFSHSEIARCFYSEHTRLSAAATKSLDTDCVTNDDPDIPTAVKALDCAFFKTQLNLADISCKRS